jgi:hypothetical protein
MYVWLWRHLPAKSPAAKAAITVVLIGVILLTLWYFGFPWIEQRIKFDHGSINDQ